MYSTCLLAAMFVSAPELPAAAAMVLDVTGSVTLKRGQAPAKPLKEMDILRVGDLVISEREKGKSVDGKAVVVFLGDGHRETLKAGNQVTVGKTGAEPASAVVREESKAPKASLASLQRLAGDGTAGVGMFRAGTSDRAPAIAPLLDTIVLTDRPDFAWPADKGSSDYTIELKSGDGKRLIWMAKTQETKLAYPEKQPLLERGSKYRWQVLVQTGDLRTIVADGRFQVAAAAEALELAGLELLGKSENPADLLLAAVAYDAHGVAEAALASYEKLAAKRPNVARFQAKLAEYYDRAGQPEKAKSARERAKELTPKTEKLH